MPDLIESQIRAGLESEARSTLAEFEAQAQRTGRGWALAAAARCRGLLAPPESIDAIFAEAHRLVSALPSPFERARTELCWGERLRRDGRRIEARRHLHDALERFQALGAAPWAEKAERELRSSGGRAQRGPRARSDELTPQQMQIATMVAEGRTNRNIADSLFLSPKTIEFHLGHVFRKLDVSNRTELARALLTSSPPPNALGILPARGRARPGESVGSMSPRGNSMTFRRWIRAAAAVAMLAARAFDARAQRRMPAPRSLPNVNDPGIDAPAGRT